MSHVELHLCINVTTTLYGGLGDGSYLWYMSVTLFQCSITCYLLVWSHAITALSRLAAHSLRVALLYLPAG